MHVSVYPEGTPLTFQGAYATIDPAEYIKGGRYPCNTYVSGWFHEDYDGSPHEGVDFSGREANLIPGWQYGISGSDGMNKNYNRR